MLKLVFYSFIFIAFSLSLCAQQKDSVRLKKNTDSAISSVQAIDSLGSKTDSLKTDTLKTDSLKKDTVPTYIPTYADKFLIVLNQNQNLNFKGKSNAMMMTIKKPSSQDNMFYTLLILIALLAFLRYFYVRYFNNLFRVFFNTSLRQSQLTDQLLQAKLPSLFFNIISVSSFGLFIFFLLKYFEWIAPYNTVTIILMCILCMSIIYFFKFIILKFIGWVTGFKEVTNRYIFIIFLINKILGIILIPFILIMAFSTAVLVKIAVLITAFIIALMFLMRFYRSYGLLQHQLKFNTLHFCMYILGIEIMPVLLIYKGLVLLLSKIL